MKKLKPTLKALVPAIAAATLAAAEPAYAGGSGSNVNTLFQTILTIMQGVGVVVVTIGLSWGGYKMVFKGANLQDVAGPVIGSIVVGAAPWIASLILS